MLSVGSIFKGLQQGFIGWFNKENNASFLFVTAALGWVLASAAQTFGLVVNKDLTKEEKKFLIPQEIADGAANIAMYAVVTTKLMKMAENLTKPGKNGKPFIVLKDAAGKALDYTSNMAQYAKTGRDLKTGAAILGGVISTCILTPIVRNAFGSFVKKKEDGLEAQHKTGAPSDIYNTRTQPYFAKTYGAVNTAYPHSSGLKI